MLFVAGGTGFAPIKSMIEQILRVFPERKNLVLYWGAHDSSRFYELDVIASWLKTREISDRGFFRCSDNSL